MKLRTGLIGGATALATVLAPMSAMGSSHREAPFISKNPKVDGTDYYAFMSYETGRAGYVTLIANYIPLEDAAGGPNFFTMDPAAIYEIHIDNTGDGVEDLTFQFQFQSNLALGGAGISLPIGTVAGGGIKNIAIPFEAAGAAALSSGVITSTAGSGLQNANESYTVNLITGPRRTGTVAQIKNTANMGTFGKPLDAIGAKSIPNYSAYAASFIQSFDMPGCTPTGVTAGTHGKIFVGQRREGFAVALGAVFDSVNVSAGPNGAGIPDVIGAHQQNTNDVGNKNVTSIAIEVPASCLANPTTKVFGSWTTASVRQARVINPTGTFAEPAREGGPFVQISRLGMPLINEVIIGLPDKDAWNNSEPKNDMQWDKYGTNPTLPAVVATLFAAVGPGLVTQPTFFPRLDLVAAFNQGINLNGINVNQIITASPADAEMVRLNTSFPAVPAASQRALGALGCFDNPGTGTGTLATLNPSAVAHPDCDTAGFPNGRRPGDDVVDIELRVAMGGLINTTDATHGGCLHDVGQTGGPTTVDAPGPGGCIPYTDGAANDATDATHFTFVAATGNTTFPYLTDPIGAP